ncbi:hypothetical protein [Achromobacter ruhlandii]|uniref:hypothetical protein n=1 Tax=Achromobacter ruhlandii TaxID=72557 RepID=UPI001581FB66|nr:hypothetical protein [Achromobacter ruhlandii]
MIKVNQIRSLAHAEKLGSIDVAGFVVARSSSTSALDLDQCRHLGSALDCSHAVHPVDGVGDVGFCREIIEELKPRYLEFTVVDPEKTESSLAQLQALARLKVGKIANGLFLLKDDLSLLDRASHMDALVHAGVELFQIEVESLIDREFGIGPKARARIGEFFSRYPTIIGDSFSKSVKVPDIHQRGHYLNLSVDSGRSYDFSQRHYALSSALRIIKGLRTDPAENT